MPDDVPDGDDEQDGEGHGRADEGGGEGGHNGQGRRGGVGQEEAWARGVSTTTREPVRAARTRAARQSVQTRARA